MAKVITVILAEITMLSFYVKHDEVVGKVERLVI